VASDEEGPFSSTRARQAIAEGQMRAAEKVLGRPHALSGTVIEGDKRGRTIGFPTANLGNVPEMLPPHGVYAITVEGLAAGVMNIGVRPTVKAGHSIEAHLFDFDQDIYGRKLRVNVLERLREEKKFNGLDALKEQIGKDVAAARAIVDRAAGLK
jgi:riboflavin kinase/FMN adenylyltransferase